VFQAQVNFERFSPQHGGDSPLDEMGGSRPVQAQFGGCVARSRRSQRRHGAAHADTALAVSGVVGIGRQLG
jgi:hypothetical protein